MKGACDNVYSILESLYSMGVVRSRIFVYLDAAFMEDSGIWINRIQTISLELNSIQLLSVVGNGMELMFVVSLQFINNLLVLTMIRDLGIISVLMILELQAHAMD